MRHLLLAATLAAFAATGVQAQSLATNLNPVANGSAPTGHIAWPVANPIWQFDFYRPGNTSLPDGTGLEVRNVTYLGRKVFDRASVPILNVEYDAGGCGCYRDWQDAESRIAVQQATTPRTLDNPSTTTINEYSEPVFPLIPSGTFYFDARPSDVVTNCERGTQSGSSGPSVDEGQFRGVAVEDYGTELVLTGNAQAGWYRYRVKWHFYADGRIWPEYSFASAPNSCTARPRRHHAYWRFDFDLEDTPSNDVVTETSMAGAVTAFTTEAARTWGTVANRTVRNWAITDAATQAGFTVTPGSQDLLLATDAFSKFDALVVRYKTNEIYDGIVFGGGCAIQHEGFINGESVNDADNVFWYRSSSARTTGTCELRGPTLTPFGYRPTASEGTAATVAPVEVQAATPNPYTSQTSVRFRVAESQAVRVVLYDALGRQVRVLLDGPVEAGVYETVEIAGGDLPAGTYVVRVEGARAAGSTRVVLAR